MISSPLFFKVLFHVLRSSVFTEIIDFLTKAFPSNESLFYDMAYCLYMILAIFGVCLAIFNLIIQLKGIGTPYLFILAVTFLQKLRLSTIHVFREREPFEYFTFENLLFDLGVEFYVEKDNSSDPNFHYSSFERKKWKVVCIPSNYKGYLYVYLGFPGSTQYPISFEKSYNVFFSFANNYK